MTDDLSHDPFDDVFPTARHLGIGRTRGALREPAGRGFVSDDERRFALAHLAWLADGRSAGEPTALQYALSDTRASQVREDLERMARAAAAALANRQRPDGVATDG